MTCLRLISDSYYYKLQYSSVYVLLSIRKIETTPQGKQAEDEYQGKEEQRTGKIESCFLLSLSLDRQQVNEYR
jgi:hypothetical protein